MRYNYESHTLLHYYQLGRYSYSTIELRKLPFADLLQKQLDEYAFSAHKLLFKIHNPHTDSDFF